MIPRWFWNWLFRPCWRRVPPAAGYGTQARERARRVKQMRRGEA